MADVKSGSRLTDRAPVPGHSMPIVKTNCARSVNSNSSDTKSLCRAQSIFLRLRISPLTATPLPFFFTPNHSIPPLRLFYRVRVFTAFSSARVPFNEPVIIKKVYISR
ncbi:hypothetical protein EVAR_77458_1 [Eumeta japonica]|uniref:Uncharacterized protein n=1 Tax=Eumeta variegata TaxID=151549 RepID=A0A4C1ZRW1_EUMVA|nr:hypothetical protein EVAR_77458_1 [Eumeta japonica]